jgi:co-chaperonin GroES (HSP10)
MRPFNSYVTLRPREDLEQAWNSSTIITPDSALIGPGVMTGERHDRTCIGEVVAVGEGTADCPDMTALKPGDIVALPLFSMSKVVALKKEICLLAEMRSIAAVVTNLGKPDEGLRAVNDWVLTKRAREEFEAHMYGGLLLPEDMLSDGMPVDGGSDGIVRVVLERCLDAGGGTFKRTKGTQRWGERTEGKREEPFVHTKPVRWTPKQRKGDLICLNPITSCRFRRFGIFYRLTPSEDCQFALED